MLRNASAPSQQLAPEAHVLVTGATGFTGRHLVRKLAAAGASIRAIARSSSDITCLKDFPIEIIRGEVFESTVIESAVKGIQYIFHLAAAYREAGLSEADYFNVHVRSTQLLAEHAARIEGFRRFVHVSTVGVHGHIDEPPADEEYRFAPGDPYQRSKAEAELWLRDFASERNLPYTVIRPAAIYGPGDKRLLKVFKMAKRGIFPILGFGKCLYHLIHVDDLTNVILLSAVHPEAVGRVFICGDEKSTTLMDMGKIAARTCGKAARFVRIPAWPFFVAGAVCEAICLPLGLNPPIYRRRVAFFTKDRAFDTSKLRTLLGYHMRHSMEEGLSETGNWYLKQGWL